MPQKATTDHLVPIKQQPWIRGQIYKLILIRGKATTNAAIHWREALGTSANSASTGTPEYYACETP